MVRHPITISERLKAVADYLPKGAHFADIGSDHAYLPIYVCQWDESAKGVAGEVNEGPFESAKQNVSLYGFQDQIDIRLGDGLTVLQRDEVEQIVIAGMGGSLIASILDDGKEKLSRVNRIIAQPNVDARSVRKWLRANGYEIIEEKIIAENKHFYEILVADYNGKTLYEHDSLEKQLLFGPWLLKNKTIAFYKKWREEKEKLQRVLNQMKQSSKLDEKKMTEFTKELQWIEEELADEKNSEK